jgi:hypothetical protein
MVKVCNMASCKSCFLKSFPRSYQFLGSVVNIEAKQSGVAGVISRLLEGYIIV